MTRMKSVRADLGVAAALAVVLCLTPANAGDTKADSGKDGSNTLFDEMRAHKAEIFEEDAREILKSCANAPVVPATLEPIVIYQGVIEALDVTTGGVVAFGDAGSRTINVFAFGMDGEATTDRNASGMKEGSLRISPDGRYLAWGGDLPKIYDVQEGKSLVAPGLENAGQTWWVGDRLLAQMYPDAVTIFARDGDTFRAATLSDATELLRGIPRGPDAWHKQHKRMAFPDQDGDLFATAEKVYLSIEQATAAGAIVMPPILETDRIYRTGDGIVSLRTGDDKYYKQDEKKPAPVLVLRDRVSGRQLATHVFGDARCTPRRMAVTKDGRFVALLAGAANIHVIDAHDLTTKAIYELDEADMLDGAKDIAFLPDGRLLAQSQRELRTYRLPVLSDGK